TLADRSIIITMQRRTASQKVERFLTARATAEAKPIRDSLAHFAALHQSPIEKTYERFLQSDLNFLGDRDADLWMPLFAVCAIAAPERLKELRPSAVALSAAKAGDDTDDSLPLKLLADIRAGWPEGQSHCGTQTLMAHLRAVD